MKIVLTGGTGLVGGALGPALVTAGHQVTVLTRDADLARRTLAYPAAIFPWVDDAVPPAEAMADADAIIHLAGANIADGRWTLERKRTLRHSRVRAAEKLGQGVGRPPKVVISASGVGVYGDRGEQTLTEATPAGGDFLAGLCRDWESRAAAIPAARHVILRFGVVLSDRGGFLEKVFTPFRLIGASRLGAGGQYLSWVHVDDLVAIILRALDDQSMDGVYNAVAPEPLTNRAWTAALATAMHARRAPPVPGVALRVAYGELATTMLGSQRAVPERLTKAGFKFKYPDFAGAVRAIYEGLRPGEFKLVREQWVPSDLNSVWDFFSSEKNLERITPDTLKFEVKAVSTPQIEKGTLIDYRLRIHGVPARWRTLISEWSPRRRFVDEQLKGPYARWHHQHDFEELGGGVRLRDVVHFKLPMGALGRLTAAPLVFKDVAAIFRHRAVVIARLFHPGR